MKKSKLFCFLSIIPIIFTGILCYGINSVGYSDYEPSENYHNTYPK